MNSSLVRDFTKTYRELRYANEGSIRLTEIEHNAYLNRLTLEITHFDAYRSINYKTNPDNTFWGYLTSFKGTAVQENLPVKFAKQRVFERINQGIWNYHQHTESLDISRIFTQEAANAVIEKCGNEGGESGVLKILITAKNIVVEPFLDGLDWIFGTSFGEPVDGEAINSVYTGFPVASPFPDIWKFKSDIPVSFLFRLESWYLVNPTVYITSNPTDTSDETEGEDEYPSPEAGDGGGSGAEFPPSSPRNADNDPRDYDDNDLGEQGTWTVQLNYFDAGNNPACNAVPDRPFVIAGYANSPPQVIVTAPPNETGAPAKSLQTSLQTLPIARDCGVTLVGDAAFTPGQVVFP